MFQVFDPPRHPDEERDLRAVVSDDSLRLGGSPLIAGANLGDDDIPRLGPFNEDAAAVDRAA